MNVPAAGIEAAGIEAAGAEPYRLRGDLQIHPRERSGRRQYWLAHPISGRVVRLAGQDFRCLIDAARGSSAMDPALFSEACAAGLVAGTRPAMVTPGRSAWWRNPLYIRLPGFPADGVGQFLAARTSWLFSSAAVLGWGLVILAIGFALLVHGGELARAFDPLLTFQANHWGIVLATLAITKMIHELAHAAVCRRMGAAVREIGVLLLCGTPCLYCDVTDSWRVESRFSRAAIMLAGVYIELVLAALAGLVWLLSEDGLLRMAALNLICVCGVSTVAFNINPLMRYDGYFVLADFLDVPNLRIRAADAWRLMVVRRLAGAACRGVGSGAAGGGGWGLALYHAASTGYRYLVLSALGGWFYLVLSRAGLEPIGRAAIVVAVIALVAGEAVRLRGVIAGRAGWGGVSRWRRWGLAGIWISLGVLLLFVPVQRRVSARGVVELHAAANVYAPRRGRVESVEQELGSIVQRGATLAQIAEPAMQIERDRLESQIQQLRMRRASLKRRSLANPELLDQLEEQTAAITATENQLRAVESAIEEMTLTAPRGGTLLPAVGHALGGGFSGGSSSGGHGFGRGASAGGNPGGRTGSQQLSDRRGQTIEAGSIWCCIGDENRKQVVLEVDASRRRFVQTGGLVQIQIDQSPAEIVTCQVADISAMRHDSQGFAELVPRDRFTVACLLPEQVAARVRIGATATGVIRGEPLRLWDWCLRRITGSTL